MIARLRKRGFTLIELMIVVAIIGILAAIAIPNFIKFQAKSKQSEAKTNLKAIRPCRPPNWPWRPCSKLIRRSPMAK